MSDSHFTSKRSSSPSSPSLLGCDNAKRAKTTTDDGGSAGSSPLLLLATPPARVDDSLFDVSPGLSSLSPPPTASSARPRRQRRATSFFDPTAAREAVEDRGLLAALKRSRLEVKTTSRKLDEELEHVPVIEVSAEEFLNPISLWEKYEHLGTKFGAVKLKPPSDWSPPFSLDLNDLRFQIREQHLHKLSHGKSFSHPLSEWSPQQLLDLNQDFTKRWFARDESPSVTEIEAEYWRLVETQAEDCTVSYAADLRTNHIGSGFPTKLDRACEAGPSAFERFPFPNVKRGVRNEKLSYYVTHPWNLTQLPTSSGSLLRHYHRDVPGVTSPWLYLGMMFSCFCWHTEDNYFAAVNYQHFGAAKIWYVVPPSRGASMEKLMKEYLSANDPDYVVHSLTVQLSPSLLLDNRLKVYRVVQQPGEFVLLWPRTYHAGLNTGFNCNEACNVAPPLWLKWGTRAIHQYRYMRPVCISHDQLLLLAACHFRELAKPLHRLECVIKGMVELLDAAYSRLSECKLPCFRMCFDDEAVRNVRAAKRLREDGGAKEEQETDEAVSLESRKDDMSVSKEFRRYPFGMRPSELLTSRALEDFVEGITQLCPTRRKESGPSSGALRLLHSLGSVAKLPAKDCDNCQTSCFGGFVMCPHDLDVMCLDCEEAHECDCDMKVAIYRQSLADIRNLVELLICCHRELEETQNEEEGGDENSSVRKRRKSGGKKTYQKQKWALPKASVLEALQRVKGGGVNWRRLDGVPAKAVKIEPEKEGCRERVNLPGASELAASVERGDAAEVQGSWSRRDPSKCFAGGPALPLSPTSTSTTTSTPCASTFSPIPLSPRPQSFSTPSSSRIPSSRMPRSSAHPPVPPCQANLHALNIPEADWPDVCLYVQKLCWRFMVLTCVEEDKEEADLPMFKMSSKKYNETKKRRNDEGNLGQADMTKKCEAE